MQNKKGKVGRKSRVKQSPQHSHQQLRCRSEERTHPMMDGRELNLGEVEQEQKEALLPKAMLTPPRDKKKKIKQPSEAPAAEEGKALTLLHVGIQLWSAGRGHNPTAHLYIH